jgi:hypothetical protein
MATLLQHPTLDDIISRLTDEGLIGLNQAGKILKRHPSTLARWALDGLQLPGGQVLKLEAFRLGGKIQTSKPALLRFAGAQQGGPVADPIQTPAARRRADAQAEAVLDAAGIR